MFQLLFKQNLRCWSGRPLHLTDCYVFHTCIIFTVLSLTAGQSITTSPVNTAAKLGTSARMNCTADLEGDVLEWRHYLTDATGSRIVESNNPDDVQDNRFDLDYNVTNGRYDLLINSVSDDLVGKYACQLIDKPEKKEAELVSLSKVQCSTTGDTSDGVDDGTVISFTCAVTYNGYKQPSLKWYHGNEITGEYTTNPTSPQSLRYIVNVTMDEGKDHFVEPFRCNLTFVASGEVGQPPMYTDYCESNVNESGAGGLVDKHSLYLTVLMMLAFA